ncbi:indoleamine 2,3-dioxygenase [Trichoderma gamsii]|uniref:Indoleamine 2,3-dioxygenase n=1 Tax=Trichoderma gamsii TaxID=398673 RepID=A0A2P4ZXG0_9HYPO|nr:indoleamine 2,3-dioxygenase [Trichoderma gamsii]PON28984.1 indoleamine 2,3-dioxygenase [Trichoderma gamsii]
MPDGSIVTTQDFHVDQRTGFVPPRMPLSRLSAEWETWEATLDAARWQKFKAAEQLLVLDGPQKLVEEEKALAWRNLVDKMPVLSVDNIKGCERQLRRAHLVLSFIVQFYAHTIPSTEPISIPRSLTVPLLNVSRELNHAPYVTYSDHALHNWHHKHLHSQDTLPTIGNLRSQLTFTGTPEEDEFYMIDIRMELKGAEAVELLRLSTDEIKAGNGLNVDRIAMYLTQAGKIIKEMKDILMSIKELVSPEVFYHDLRPWLVGADADMWGRKWAWEGKEEVEGSKQMLTKISGPTAGQSPLVPALDAYLGIEEDDSKSAFLDRVQIYMDHKHDEFLRILRSEKKFIRCFIQEIAEEQSTSSPIVVAYNAAVQEMKRFRDAHLIIVALYVIVPSKKNTRNSDKRIKISGIESGSVHGENGDDSLYEKAGGANDEQTGEAALGDDQGAQLMKFLKGFRDQTIHTFLE